ncbi:hypothetical protein RFI_12570, partial [Reticulomyxa filosa]
MQGLAHAIERLWANDIWKKTYQLRGVVKYAIIENIDYFFDRVRLLFQQSYYPTTEDMLKVRIRTTGITNAFYEADKNRNFFLHIFDVGLQTLLLFPILFLCLYMYLCLYNYITMSVSWIFFFFLKKKKKGGQRSERKKWINQFANITGIIFMVRTFVYILSLFLYVCVRVW